MRLYVMQNAHRDGLITAGELEREQLRVIAQAYRILRDAS